MQNNFMLAKTIEQKTEEQRLFPTNPIHHCTKKDDGTDITDWSYVYFGSYPQSEVTEQELTSDIIGASYNVSGDAWINGRRYRRISKDDVNNNWYFGNREYRYFKWERIKWRVLKNNGTTLFVMADKGLDCKVYNEKQEDITWENSTIRKWMNQTFLNTAFSESERNAIVEQTIVNEDNYWQGTEGGDDTKDKIFFLSAREVGDPSYGFCEYGGDSVSRYVEASEYANAMGASTLDDIVEHSVPNGKCCYWWLRTPGYKRSDASSVAEGIIYDELGDEVSHDRNACVPALHIALSSNLWHLMDDGTSGEDESGKIVSTIPENGFIGAMRWGQNFSIKFDKALDEENPLGDGTIKFHDKASGKVLLEVGAMGRASSGFLENSDGTIKIDIVAEDALPNDRDIFVTVSENVVNFADGTYNRAYSDDNFWNFHTFPVDTPSVRNNSVSKVIPINKYYAFFKPLIAECCWLADNGEKGICFGMCYSAIAWREYDSTIHKIVDNMYLSQADVDKRSGGNLSLLDYMQYGHIFQQTSVVQQTKDTNLENIEKKIRSYLNGNGQPVILGVKNSEGGHALLPVHMEKTDDGLSILLYNCNAPTTNYYLDVRKMLSGEWLEWEIRGINYVSGSNSIIYSTKDEIWCVTVDPRICDTAIGMTNRNYKESSNLLMTKLDSFTINNKENYQGNKGNGKILTPISYVNGKKSNEDYNLYWTEEDSLTIDSNGEVFEEATLCEGNREYRVSSDAPAEVSIGLETGNDNIVAQLQGSGKINIQNNVVIDDMVQSVTIEGQSNTGKVEVSEKSEGYAVKGMQNLEIVQQYDEGESSLNVKGLNDNQEYQVVVDGDRVSVGEDTNGDGTVDKIHASNNGKMKQSITGTSAYSKTYGNAPFKLDAVLEKGSGSLTYASSNPKVAEVSDKGEVKITGAGKASITVIASETEEYKKCEYQISINVAKASQRISGTAKYSKTIGSKPFRLDAKRTVGEGKISYLSANRNVATVSDSGTVTLKKPGNTVITVTAAETANYNACTFRIKLSVTAPKKGTALTDPKTKAKYKVTKQGKSVEYSKPKDKKATKATVPATVTISGVKYNVTAIGANAFSGCKKLKSVSIGKNVESIGAKAFANCTALGKLTLPSKASKIGKQAFANCGKLKDITIKSTKLTSKSIGAKAFQGIHAKATIKVPKAKKAAYQKLLKSKGIGKKVKVK